MLSLAALPSLISYAAAAIGCGIAVPQIVQLVRSGRAEGISAASWEVNTLSAVAWLSYGLRTVQGAQVLANGCTALGGLCVLWLVVAPGARRRGRLGRIALAGTAVVGAVLLLPMAWLTLPLAATGLLSRVPQLRATASTWWHRRASGVSAQAWAMSVGCTALWLCTGLLTGQGAVVWSSAIACGTAALILAAECCPRPGGWASLAELDAEAAELVAQRRPELAAA